MFFIDFETRSEADLAAVGAWAYSLHPSTEVLCMGWAREDGEPSLWYPGEVFPAIEGDVWAHNAFFELAIWRNVLRRPDAGIEWRDTMAAAAACALPLGLDKLAQVLLGEGKDEVGARVMRRVSRLDGPVPEDDLATLGSYCRRDVRLEREVFRWFDKRGLANPEEGVQRLDREAALRGVRFDLAAVTGMERISTALDLEDRERFQALTGIDSPDKRDAVLNWLNARLHISLPDLTAASVAERLADGNLESILREVLELRLRLGRKASRKLQRIREAAPDGFARGLLQYHGAATGRWAGRLVQPQNLPRPKLGVEPGTLAAVLRLGDAELAEAVLGDARQAVSDGLRASIIAPEGRVLVGCDFSQIEARVAAWLGGERWKLDAFRQGRDLYCETASQILRRPVSRDDPERQIGKVAELAFGFGGGLNAWRQFDSTASDADALDYRDAWRARHSGIRHMWNSMENAALNAADGQVGRHLAPPVEFTLDRLEGGHRFLTARLPSGRLLRYFNPTLMEKELPWGGATLALHYWAQKTGRWTRVSTFGGKLFENVVQAVARDIMVEALLRVGPEPQLVLTVHDEMLWSARPDLDVEVLLDKVREVPPWADGLPLAAEMWKGDRYGK